MNNNTKFKDCCDFITSKLPNIKRDFTNTNIKEIKVILKNLIDKRVIYLIENGNNDDDDLRNDLELSELEDFYGMICREMYYQNKNN
jgi:hypothetical protein